MRGLLAAVFITLRLAGVISWERVWVLAPLWIPPALTVIFCVIGLILIRILEKKGKKGERADGEAG